MIAGIVLAVMVPLLILAYCCFRRQRRNQRKGLENKALKILTTSRHSLNDSSSNGLTTKSSKSSAPKSDKVIWKKEIDSSSGFSSDVTHMDLVQSSPSVIKNDASSNSTYEHASSRSPMSSSTSNAKTSPSDSQSSSQASRERGAVPARPASIAESKSGRHRYDAVYYTHEPIRGAPQIDFQDDEPELEINHRNTEV